MSTTHEVRAGECLSSIADDYGFFWETLWNHPQNQGLKERSEDPNTIAPGELVFIPDKTERLESRNTGAKHVFKKRGIPAQISLQLHDGEVPRSNQDYVFFIDGEPHSGTTDEDGMLLVHIPPTAKVGKLTIGPDEAEFEFALGHLQPIDEIEGVQARLNNLGFHCGDVDGVLNDETREALKAFQNRFELEVTGEPDEPTRDKLVEIHDEENDFATDDAGDTA